MKRINIAADENNNHARRIKDTVAIVNASQNYFFLQFQDIPTSINDREPIIRVDSLQDRLLASKQAGHLICITSRSLEDNWFSHEYRECSIITTYDWEEVFAPPSLRSYLLYQIAQSLIVFEAELTEEMLLRLVHEPPKGCAHDLCIEKPTIKLGMVAGNLCLSCEGLLLQYGMDKNAIDAIRRILSVVRDEAVGRPKVLDYASAFIVMRFSHNDENDNAYRYGISPGLSDVGIKVHRGNDTVRSNQILDQVLRSIERSRFIVAKVDSDNLNVYFELGAAMGLGKDVLLISESSLVLNLPSDLRNWECLIYERGNYEQLRQRVAKFYRDNFGLR